ASRARNAPAPGVVDQISGYSAARMHFAGGGLGGALAGVLLSAAGYGAGAGVRVPVPGSLWNGPVERAGAGGGSRAGGGWLCGGLLAGRAPHGGRTCPHVALAVGQPGARRRSTGTLVVGLCHGRAGGDGNRARRSASGARGAYGPDPGGAGGRVGLYRRCRRVRSLRRVSVADAARSGAGA